MQYSVFAKFSQCFFYWLMGGNPSRWRILFARRGVRRGCNSSISIFSSSGMIRRRLLLSGFCVFLAMGAVIESAVAGPPAIDTDGDTIPDNLDVDNDNDGILDTVECPFDFADFSGIPFGIAELRPGDPAHIAMLDINGNPLPASLTVNAPVVVQGAGIQVSGQDIGGGIFQILRIQDDSPADLGDAHDITLDFGAPQGVAFAASNVFGASNVNQSDQFTFTPIGAPAGFAWEVFTANDAAISFSGTSITVRGGATAGTGGNPPFAGFEIRANAPISGIVIRYETIVNLGSLNSGRFAFAFCPDTDQDGRIDMLDLDSDNDGIPDNVEGQTTQNYVAPNTNAGNPSGYAINTNGLNTAYTTVGGFPTDGIAPVNTDMTDAVDYLDDDSDNDTESDALESGFTLSASVGTNGLNNDPSVESVDDYTDVNGLAYQGGLFSNLDDSDNDTAANGSDANPTVTDLDYRDNSVALSIDDVSVAEDAGNAVFTVSIPATLPLPVTATYTTSDGTANAGTDYTTQTNTVTIPAGSTSTTVSIPIIDDALDENNETFTVTLSAPVNGTLADGSGTGTITDNDPPPAISIDDVSVAENAGSASFTVSIPTPSGLDIMVDVATSDGSATQPSDYTTVPTTTVTIPAGSTTVNVSVPIINDALSEPNETYNVDLTNPVNATIVDNQGLGTITNDDGTPALTITDISVNEAAGTAMITVSTPVASASAFTVDYATSDGSATAGADYTAQATTTLTFPAGSLSQTITIPIINDALDENNETFNIDLSNPSGGATISDNQGVVTINDDDNPPGLSVDDITVTEGSIAGFTVSLGTPSGLAVMVDVTTTVGTASAGSDYTTTTQTLTIPAGSTSVAFNVPTLNDALDENTETFTVDLSTPVNATIADAQGDGTINDDDPPPAISINDLSIDESGGSAMLTVTLSAASGLPVTVDFTTTDASAVQPGDYTSTSGTVMIAAGATTGTISIPILDDLLDEPNETLTVDLTNPGNATIGDPQGVITITDNDNPPGVSISDVSVNEAAGTATLTISIPSASGQDVSVDYTSADVTAIQPGDYTTTSGTATITAGTTSTTITVPIINDALDENNETLNVDLSNPINANIIDGQSIVTITDDDLPPNATIADVTVDESAGTAVFTVTLDAPSALPISLDYTSANGSANAPGDYSAVTGTVNIPAGSTTGTITVPILEDTLDEPNETLLINLTNPGNVTLADPQGQATITDNDPTPAVSINDVTVNEGDGLATLTVSIPTASGQDIMVDVTTTDGSAAQPGDYTTTVTTVTIPAGSTSVTVDVPIIDDALNEGQETFNADLANPINATLGDNTGVVTVDDDDAPPGISIADVSVDEAAGIATLTLTIPAISALPVSVDYTTNDGTGLTGALAGLDYTLTTGTATIPAGQTTVTIDIPISEDLLDELDETLNVDLSNPVNSTLTDSQAVVTITDNDPTPELTISDVTVNEGDGTATVTVTLDTASGLDTSVDFSSNDGSAGAPDDYSTVAGTLSIPAGQTSATITVPISDDSLDELDENLLIDLANPSDVTVIDNQAQITIIDNDPPPMLSIGKVTVNESDGSANVIITLDTPSSLPITVDYTTTDGSATQPGDYTTTTGQITIPPGQTTATITVPIIDDAAFEFSETLTVDLTNPVNVTLAGNQGIITINDDDLAPDTDGDSIPDFQDIDDDNDGIPDLVEQATAINGGDTDGDGIPDSVDLDSDGDGIPDLDEGGLSVAEIAQLDTNNDGVIDPTQSFGPNGLADNVETTPESDQIDYNNDGQPDAPVDTDGDGRPDFQDLDADNDGINDLIEAGQNPGIVDPNGDGVVDGLDSDGDGIPDLADNAAGFGGLTPPLPDTDGDNIADFRDLDSDNDGLDDLIEGGLDPTVVDTNGDGIVDGPDGDNDGIQDPADDAPISYGDANSGPAPNGDNDSTPNYQDLDSDNDSINDVIEGGHAALDSDGDGIVDGIDSDGDGILDPADPNPNFGDSGVTPPPNTDGIDNPDYLDVDSNNDGINDVVDSGNGALDSNGDGMIDGADTDGDGILDPVDLNPTGFGDVPGDTDGDGILDNIDIDDDNDGIPDLVEQATAINNGDSDGDGIPDSLDLDSDGDGIPDLDEGGLSTAEIAQLDTDNDGVIDPTQVFGPNGLADNVETAADSGQIDYNNDGQPDTPVDTDGDGRPDFQDLDADNDGINDLIEAGQDPGVVDPNGDGVVDGLDTDGDGIPDLADNNPGGFGGLTPPLPDTDGDNVADFRDLDSDNDGINDLVEGGLDPAVADSNGDGVVDGPDTDQDGIQDPADMAPTVYGDAGSGSAPNNDNDPVPDYLDLDSDNDSLLDATEGGNGALDGNADGIIDGVDSDGDGIIDAVDLGVGFGDQGEGAPPNSDGIDTPDYIDLDSDNDGMNDIVEAGNAGLDTDGDGQVDGIDSDGDGIIDAVDPAVGFGGGSLVAIPTLSQWAMLLLLLMLGLLGLALRAGPGRRAGTSYPA